ncbi:MAG: ATP-binding protein [Myxococcales bacterium]
MIRAVVAVSVLTGLTLHAGIVHLLLYAQSRGNRDRADLYFAYTALLVAGYNLCCAGLYLSTSVAQGVPWFRGQVFFVSGVAVAFMYFLREYSKVSVPPWFRRLAWLLPVIGVTALVERHGLVTTAEESIKRVPVPLFGEVVYYEPATGPLYDAWVVGLIVLTANSLRMAFRVRSHGDPKRARFILPAVLVFSFGALHDALAGSGVFRSAYLLEYSWTSIILLAGHSLSRELNSAAEAKQALADSRVRLAHAERLESVGKLAGGLAHDLNNMLTPVIGYAQLACFLASPGSKLQSILDNLLSAAHRAAALTRQLLAFARKQVLEVQPINLAESVQQLQPLLRQMLPESVHLSIHATPGVPNVEADPGQLERVWMNLVANARDAMPAGGELCFDVEPCESSGVQGVAVAISDTGFGMTDVVLEHIFEPFFSTKPRGKGTGLGLSTVHGIVEQLGGHISVDSRLGKGTTFRLFFPKTDKAPRQQKAPSNAPPRMTRTVRVLVVDDDRAVLDMVVELIEHFGLNVVTAGSLDELNRVLAREVEPIDVLLTDVVLPDTDGYHVQHVVNACHPTVPCIFMTGHADEVLAPRGLLRNHMEVLHKPFSAQELLEKLKVAIGELRSN